MSKIVYTIGYSNDSPEDFLKRLTDARIDYVFDIRRQWSKSWCSKYHQGKAMKKTIESAGIQYREWYHFSNRFDRLDAYKAWLDDKGMIHIEELASRKAWRDGARVCFLCAEREAIIDDKVNCHRVYVAEAIAKQLGEGWMVKHL